MHTEGENPFPFFIVRMMATVPAVEDLGKKAMSGLPY
jgi:hypothetical protein